MRQKQQRKNWTKQAQTTLKRLWILKKSTLYLCAQQSELLTGEV